MENGLTSQNHRAQTQSYGKAGYDTIPQFGFHTTPSQAEPVRLGKFE